MEKVSTDHVPVIQVNGLNKSFGGPPVLRELHLDVEWGERLVLFGGNGSGKTTLVKTLATLMRPDAGTVRVAGWDARDQGPMLRRSIGVVTHQPLLYDELTGYENLRFYGRMYRVVGLEARIRSVAATMGMVHHLNTRVRTLSHGMQKRLSLARALLHDPPILLLDEPETGLDPEALELLDVFLTTACETPRTVLMTTHNLERGLAIGNSVAILAQGRIVYHESRHALAVAEFRGTFLHYMEATS